MWLNVDMTQHIVIDENSLDDPELDIADLTDDDLAARLARRSLSLAVESLRQEASQTAIPDAIHEAANRITHVLNCGCHGLGGLGR